MHLSGWQVGDKRFLIYLIDRGITLESELFPDGIVGIASRGSFKLLVIQKHQLRIMMAVQRENGQCLFFISVPLPMLPPFVFCFKFIAYMSVCSRQSVSGSQGRERSIAHLLCVLTQVLHVTNSY